MPALCLTLQLASSTDPKTHHDLLDLTGEFSARVLISALLAPPRKQIIEGWRGPRWLKKNRRYFSVAAIANAALRTMLYIIDLSSFESIVDQLPRRYTGPDGWPLRFSFRLQ